MKQTKCQTINSKFYLTESMHFSNSKNLKIKIYKTILLPVLLHFCEAWSLILKAEFMLTIFENTIRRQIFGPKMDETVEGEKGPAMSNLIVCTVHIIK